MSVTVFPAPSTGSTAKSPTTVIINSTQSWSAPVGVSEIEVFLVGGGGGGGGAGPGEFGAQGHKGGGGGGGGVLTQTIAVTPGTSYTVTIGGGGAAGTNSMNSPGSHGTSSTFGSLLTSFGGSGGTSSNGVLPGNGQVSSGGGQGTASGAEAFSGGGGGAANVIPYITGVNTLHNFAGPRLSVVQGVLGSRINYSFGNPGVDGYGAGGAGATSQTSRVFGGLNAGGGAFEAGAATAGTANFGGGGGGGFHNVSTYSAANGGSGRCIIRYWS